MTQAPERIKAWVTRNGVTEWEAGSLQFPPDTEVEYIRADLASPKVKPLKWTATKVANVQRWTASVMGRAMYEVGVHEHGGAYLMTNWRGLSHEVFDDFDYAKAAAQADYERRILSALEAGHE